MLHAAVDAGRACNMLVAAYMEAGALTCNALGGCGTRQLTCYTFGGQFSTCYQPKDALPITFYPLLSLLSIAEKHPEMCNMLIYVKHVRIIDRKPPLPVAQYPKCVTC